MDSLMKQKESLRAQARKRRALLGEEELRASNEGIRHTIQALAVWQQAQVVFLYRSLGREPDTLALLQEAWAQGKRTALPRCLGRGVMEARQVTSLHQLVPGAMGIPEPGPDARLVPPEALQLVLAPCLAADALGNRLGQGGGYYDRYLPQVACPTLCLCHQALVLPRLPVEAWDMPLTGVVTGERVYGAC